MLDTQLSTIKNTNIKAIINFYNNTQCDINILFNHYKPSKGYLYCLYNEMFQFYGDNVYKLGNTNNLKTRLHGYTTAYIQESTYKLTSSLLPDKELAEMLLFDYLHEFRVNQNREFFNCNFDKVIEAFNYVEQLFNNFNTSQDILQYFIHNHHSIIKVKDYEVINKIKRDKKKDNIKNNFLAICNKNNKLANYDDKVINQREIFYDIVKKLGFKKINSGIVLSNEKFKNNLFNLFDSHYIFTDFSECRKLFGLDNKLPFDFYNTRYTLSYINSILNKFNFKLNTTYQTNKKRISYNCFYHLDINDKNLL